MKIAKCTWDAVQDADGYNVYLDGVKVNEELITDTHFYIPGLEPDQYEAYATSVQQGIESDPSEVSVFVIEEPVVLLCDADGIAMTTDFYTIEQTEQDEVFLRKHQLDGTIIESVESIFNWGTLASSTKFMGLSPDESLFYIHTGGQSETIKSFDIVTGDFVDAYDHDGSSLERIRSDYATIARDGRLCAWNTNNWRNDALVVLNDDLQEVFTKTFYQAPATDGDQVGVKVASFDACGNLAVCTSHEFVLFDPQYNEIFRINRDELFAGTSIGSLAVGVNSIFLLAAGFDKKIAFFNANNLEWSVISEFDRDEGGAFNLTNVHENGSVVDKDGNCWFTMRSEDADVYSENQWVGLGRVTPTGEWDIWPQFVEGGTGGTPTARSAEYSNPAHKLLFSFDGLTRVVDIDSIDPDTSVPIPFETTVDNDGSSRFSPGEYPVLKGVDE